MTYQINKTDGTVLTSVVDGQVDEISTDLTLIGKNYSGFGEALNENFVKLLENFASTIRPEQPLRGQIWFDVTDLKLKVYNGREFVPISSATLSRSRPEVLSAGDLWYDENARQLFFYDGNGLVLLAPAYSNTQGPSGFIVETVLDITNQNRVVTLLYTGGTLLGIFAKDSFTPKNPINGYTGDIVPGFNVAELSGIKFDLTTTNSEQLGGIPAASYMRKDISETSAGRLSIVSDEGLTIGNTSTSGSFTPLNSKTSLSVVDGNVLLRVNRAGTQDPAISISPMGRSVNIYTDNLGPDTSTVTIGGDLIVSGTITSTDSTVTTIETSTLSVENKNIILANTAEPNDSDLNGASGGGIILKGTTDHTLIWTNDTRAWNSSEHINLVSSESVMNPVFKINGVEVLSATSLGPSITSIPGVTSFGIQTRIEVGDGSPVIVIQGNKISTTANQDLELQPRVGRAVALIGSPRISGLGNPVEPADASNRAYVDSQVQGRDIILSLDLSDGKNDQYIINEILNRVAPTQRYRVGTVARILGTIISTTGVTAEVNQYLRESRSTFNTPSGTAPALIDVEIDDVPIPPPGLNITRVVKEFRIITAEPNPVWSIISTVQLP
jgi:hypothetical protein